MKTDEWDKTDLNQIPDLKRSQQREVNMAEIRSLFLVPVSALTVAYEMNRRSFKKPDNGEFYSLSTNE